MTDWRKTCEALREVMLQRASQFVSETARKEVVVSELPLSKNPAGTKTFQTQVQDWPC